MAGLVPAIHAFPHLAQKAWMAPELGCCRVRTHKYWRAGSNRLADERGHDDSYPPHDVASPRRDSYSPPPRSERGAARLAHLSGGQGVASSNLAAPTSSPKLKIAKASKKGCPSGGLLFHARITLLSRPKAGRELFRTGEVKNPAEGSSHANGSSSLLPRSLP
jgi:hypothetical protein